MKQIKKVLFILILQLIIISPIKALDIYSNHAILYNLNDDEIIYTKNENNKVSIASLTKIMTTIVALENIENLDEQVEITEEAFYGLEGYAKAGFKIGEKVTYKDLLYGIMLPSGAECARAISLNISGDIDGFVELMNKKAQELGLMNTRFSNPIGMDDINNYSTVKEVAELLKYALNNKEFYEIFTTREYLSTTGKTLESTIKERAERYNLDASNILGSKTGFTDEAGYCLASISKINNVNYLLVTTKANTNMPYQIVDAINIYDYYSKNYSYKKILSYNQLLASIPIKNSLEKEHKIYSNYDKYLYLPNEIDINKLTYEYIGINEITKNNKQNETLGKINIKDEDKIIYTYDIKLDKEITFIDFKILTLAIILIFLLAYLIIKKIKNNMKTKEK